MAKGLTLAEPPRRRRETQEAEAKSVAPAPASAPSAPTMFSQGRESDIVQFNKRIEKSVADGYAMLAIKTGKKVPELLKEALEALEAKYGKI